jgi:hypothetical protein
MTTPLEAMQQALEALESWSGMRSLWCAEDQKALDTLRAALERPEQEPVEPLKGWKLNHARKHPDDEGVAEIGYLDPEDDRFAPILTIDTGLYYQDAQALPLAVAILSMLSAQPPRREWQRLTVEEIAAALPHEPGHLDFVCARAIEQALREKNHG